MPNVIVVGGGIIGCACAYELATRGASVILLERDELAAGASGRNHGLLLAPLDPALVPMAAASTALYEQIQERSPLRFNLDPSPIGFLVVAADEAEIPAAMAEAEAAAACGVRIERLDEDGIRELEPALAAGLAGGWLMEDGRRLDPAALTVALGLLAGRRGADIGRSITARALFEEHGRVRGVITDEGLIPADAVVVAAGPWTGSLLRPIGIDLPVGGARGWLVHLSPRQPVLSRLLNRAGWHILGEESGMAPQLAGAVAETYPDAGVGTLMQPNADGTMLAGGSRQPVITSEPEDPTVPQRILREAIRLIPALAEAEVRSAWWGIRPMTPDGRPIVGKLRDGLFVATGHGGQGVILGGGTAALVASMVLGERPPFDAAPYLADRFSDRVNHP